MKPSELQPLARFSDRVGDYVRFRPGYPAALLDLLVRETGLATPGAPVADVGAGTGIFTALLLDRGARVFAVEPNDAMREAAEAGLGGRHGFVSLKGNAEATGLAEGSVQLVACAQAFHWFDPEPTRREFVRILAPGGSCALVWNTPVVEGSDFGAALEDFRVRFGTDYQKVRGETKQLEGRIPRFFTPGSVTRHVFPSAQSLDWEALLGRWLSSSFAPRPGHPGYEPAAAALREIHARFQDAGQVRMEYITELHLGRFG